METVEKALLKIFPILKIDFPSTLLRTGTYFLSHMLISKEDYGEMMW